MTSANLAAINSVFLVRELRQNDGPEPKMDAHPTLIWPSVAYGRRTPGHNAQ